MAKRKKATMVGFKVDDALRRYLFALPNRSEFIRRAILTALRRSCPLCLGQGTVPIPIGEHFAPILDANSRVACHRCGRTERIPTGAETADDQTRRSWTRFLDGGTFCCADCLDQDAE